MKLVAIQQNRLRGQAGNQLLAYPRKNLGLTV